MPDQINLQDFLAGFLLEAEEHLHSVNRNLVATAEALKKGQAEPRAVRELFRSLHTIKGLSSMVGAEPIVDLSHELEGLLRTADRSGGHISEENLDLVLQGSRAVEERVRAIAKGGIKSLAPAPAPLLEALALAQVPDSPPAASAATDIGLPPEILQALSASDREQLLQAPLSGKRVAFVEFQPSPAKAAAGINITTVRERIAKLGDLVKVLPRTSGDAPTGISFGLLLVTARDDAELTAAVAGEAGAARFFPAGKESSIEEKAGLPAQEAPELDAMDMAPGNQSSIRVDIRRLDDTLEQLSSLFVTRFKLEKAVNDLAAAGVDTRELKSVLSLNSRQLQRLRTSISEARMVPLSELLQRLPLVVRGITRDSGKSVNVSVHAGTAEVDKAVADKIFPAVVHLVRNAVDHAIETREERKKAGKAEAGELSITCDGSSGTNLILSITDDGRGISRDAVARKAGRAPAANDDELLEQICTAGLSTSQAVTLTSGRGMGMEIVKRTAEMLGGSITLETTPGKGTKFTLRVPVTVTIVDVLSFVSGKQNFVAPIAVVDEIVEVEPGQAVRVPSADPAGRQPHLIQYRGQTIPLFGLEALLERRADDRVAPKALIVKHNKRLIAFGVDRMIGQQEAVVRPLDDSLVRVTGMAGATDLGDGRPTIVLDLGILSGSVQQSAQKAIAL